MKANDLTGGGEGLGGLQPASSQGGTTVTRKSSSYGKPFPVAYGTCAVRGLPLWLRDKGAQTFGVAMRGVQVQYAFCLGPAISIDSVVFNKRTWGAGGTNFNFLGPWDSYTTSFQPPEFHLGDGTTTVWWPYASSSDSVERLCWPHIAIMRGECFPLEGAASGIPEVQAVGRWKLATNLNTRRSDILWQRYDAAPGDVLRDLLENATYGMGLPAGTLVTATGQDGTAASSYDRYCNQSEWLIALAVVDSAKVGDIVEQILTATNSVLVRSGAHFKVIPLGDVAVGTYTPCTTSVAITNDDLLANDGEDAVSVQQRSWTDVYNAVPVEYSSDTKLRDAELVTAESMEQASVALLGVRRSPDTVSLPCIRTEIHAAEISGILARRLAWHRSRYEFRVSTRIGAALEVADLVTLTHSPSGLSGQLARVEEIEVRPDGTYSVWAREWVLGGSRVTTAVPEAPAGLAQSPLVPYDAWAASQSALSQVSGGGSGLMASASPAFASGMGAGEGIELVVSELVTVTASGGTSPYSYAWTKTTGTTMGLSASTGAATTFGKSLGVGGSASAVYRCTVTDAASNTTYVEVTVDLSN